MNSKKEKEKETKEDLKIKIKNTHTHTLDKVQHTHINNYKNYYDPYIRYQHTNTFLQNTFHILDTLDTKHDKTKHTYNNNITNNYNPYIQSQHTNRSLQTHIPYSKYTPNIQIHPLQNNNHVSKFNSGSAFDLGASGLPYYCTSICVRSCCNWHASCVDSSSKTKQTK